MKEIEISISDKRLFERMKNESGKSALVKESAGQPSKLSARLIMTDDDKRLFDDYVLTAINECAVTIGHYLGECTVSHDTEQDNNLYRIHRFCITIPANYPEGVTEALEDIITNIVFNRCMQQWYILVKSDDANLSAGKIQLCMKQLQELLALRKKP